MSDDNFSAPSRLTTTDKDGHRIYVHPQEVSGKWNTLRRRVFWGLILFYLILPWIYWNGKQVILLNLPAREFYIFGTTFYGHDGPLLIYLLLGFILLVSFVTSLWGRIWCGYACPQTVFIESVYRPIEKFIEGSARKREKLQQAPWGIEKITKKSLKWFLFLLVSLHIVHSALGYFVGTRELLYITFSSPSENPTLFITMLVMTGIILLDFGWFREQFCIIACPYGRFQSIVMDENSMIVAYDKDRGEPRKRTKGISADEEGDCVNCNRCVNVCPTGIDIRDGLQMECIACTMCIDACDDIMERVKKPKGLIRYSSELELSGKPKKVSFRVYIYLFLFLAMMGGLFSHLQMIKGIRYQFIKGGKEAFQVVKNEKNSLLLNHFKLKLSYYGEEKLSLDMRLASKEALSDLEIIVAPKPMVIQKENKEFTVFFKFPKSYLENGRREIALELFNLKTNELVKKMEVSLVGPIR